MLYHIPIAGFAVAFCQPKYFPKPAAASPVSTFLLLGLHTLSQIIFVQCGWKCSSFICTFPQSLPFFQTIMMGAWRIWNTMSGIHSSLKPITYYWFVFVSEKYFKYYSLEKCREANSCCNRKHFCMIRSKQMKGFCCHRKCYIKSVYFFNKYLHKEHESVKNYSLHSSF